MTKTWTIRIPLDMVARCVPFSRVTHRSLRRVFQRARSSLHAVSQGRMAVGQNEGWRPRITRLWPTRWVGPTRYVHRTPKTTRAFTRIAGPPDDRGCAAQFLAAPGRIVALRRER